MSLISVDGDHTDNDNIGIDLNDERNTETEKKSVLCAKYFFACRAETARRDQSISRSLSISSSEQNVVNRPSLRSIDNRIDMSSMAALAGERKSGEHFSL